MRGRQWESQWGAVVQARPCSKNVLLTRINARRATTAWSEGKASVGKTMSSVYVRAPAMVFAQGGSHCCSIDDFAFGQSDFGVEQHQVIASVERYPRTILSTPASASHTNGCSEQYPKNTRGVSFVNHPFHFPVSLLPRLPVLTRATSETAPYACAPFPPQSHDHVTCDRNMPPPRGQLRRCRQSSLY